MCSFIFSCLYIQAYTKLNTHNVHELFYIKIKASHAYCSVTFSSSLLNILLRLKPESKLIPFDGWIVLLCVVVWLCFSLYPMYIVSIFSVINNVAMAIHTQWHICVCIDTYINYSNIAKLPPKKVGQYCIFTNSIWECLFTHIFVVTGFPIFLLFLCVNR